jgi:hypothetical protein
LWTEGSLSNYTTDLLPRKTRNIATLCCVLLAVTACSEPVSDSSSEGDYSALDQGVDGAGVAGAAKMTGAFSVVADDYADGALLSVSARTPKDVWVVGGEKGSAVALHYDGKAWERRDPPVKQQLWWVHQFDDGKVVTVGESGVVALYGEATWTVLSTQDTGATYFGAWGASSDDFWVVGGPWARAPKGMATQKRILRHFSGGKWSDVDTSQLVAETAQSLFKVWGRSAGDVTAVGDSGSALHFDGEQWSKQDTGLVGVVLFTVTGGSDGSTWAIGGFGTGQLLSKQAGGAWKDHDVGPLAPAALQGVWTGDGETVWASGWDGYVAALSNGEWVEYETGTDKALHAVTGDGAGGIWSVGGDITTLQDSHVGAIVVYGANVAKLP